VATSWGGEAEEAAAISELFVLFLYDVRAEQAQTALELVRLVAGHGVVLWDWWDGGPWRTPLQQIRFLFV